MSFLVSQGHTIVARNYRKIGGELDIISQKGNELFAVEVKYRKRMDEDFHPLLVFNRDKVSKMQRAMQSFLMYHNVYASYRIAFCLITVDAKGKVDFYSDLWD